jgi:hypothetical protein
MRQFRPENKLSRAENLFSTDLDQETILMSIEAGAYYGLAGPARAIWEILEVPLTFSALVERLLQSYHVSPETCVADVGRFLDQMEREGLISVE